MKNIASYNYDAINNTLTISADFAKKCNDLNSAEYRLVRQLRAENPGLTVQRKTINASRSHAGIENCSSIGINNKGLGMIITDESDFSLDLTTIPTGLNPQVSSFPSTVTAIQSNVFAKEVTDFRLSMSLNDIAVDAFPKGSTFIVDSGSYAELWCSENGFGYTVEGQEDDLSWLNS